MSLCFRSSLSHLSEKNEASGVSDLASRELDEGVDRPIIHPLSRYRLAKLYEETGQKEKAIEQYAKALETWKTSEEGLFEVGDTRERVESLKAETLKK